MSTVSECVKHNKLNRMGELSRVWVCPDIITNISMATPYSSIEIPINFSLPDLINEAEVVKSWYETRQLLCIIYKNSQAINQLMIDRNKDVE